MSKKQNKIDIEEMNRIITQHPKVFSISVIITGILFCFIFAPIGISLIIAGILFYIIFPKIFKNYKSANISNPYACIDFEFPDTDGHGHHILTVYDMNVSGVFREQNGIDPQSIIPNLYPGEQILLEADPNNEFDEYAVKVKILNGIQIGWLPMGENLQMDISRRLNAGQTVYARVKKGFNSDYYHGKIGLIIEVARYSTR